MTWKNERDCPPLEKYARKMITSVFYFRGYRLLHPDRPFLTPGAIKHLENYLTTSMSLFEWGSGISSTWFSPRVSSYNCIEHDPAWYRRVKESLESVEGADATIKLIEEGGEADLNWELDWPHYSVLGHVPEQSTFLNYVQAIDEFPDEHFDCIIVDGRARVACTLHAMPKLKAGGILVVDDSHRSRYREIYQLLVAWPVKNYDFGLQRTTIFEKV